jgi:hypothetical protein
VFEDETPVAWTALPHHVPVVAADGTELGHIETVLGDEPEDIFHGLVIRRTADGELVELPAARVTRMTEGHVVTDLADGDAQGLPPYRKP